LGKVAGKTKTNAFEWFCNRPVKVGEKLRGGETRGTTPKRCDKALTGGGKPGALGTDHQTKKSGAKK